MNHQSPKTIPSWLAEIARIRGSASAISSVDERKPLSYQGLLAQTRAIACQLNDLGIVPGDPVAVALDDGPEFLVAILSVASGATAFPLNPNQPETVFTRYFDLLNVKAVLVAQGSQSSITAAAKAAGICLLELAVDSLAPVGQFKLSTASTTSPQPLQPPQLGDHAVLVSTSGSTGLPKIVSLSHESFSVSINHAAEWMQLTASDRSLVLAPLSMLHALVRSSCPLLSRGGQVICTPGYNPAKILSWIDQSRPTFFTAVPSVYRSILQRIEDTQWVAKSPSLRFLVTGSDKIDDSEIQTVEAILNVPLIQFYGMSEVSPLPVVRSLPPAETPAGAVGKINPMWQVACVDEQGTQCPPHQEGEIVLKGGYINRLIGTYAVQNIRQDWFHTGDLGYLDADGFLYYTGRVDNRINRAGKKIYAGDVESILLTHPAIKEATVFGIPDKLYGECIGAVVVLHADASVTPTALRQHVADNAVSFKVPDLIRIEDALPLNPFGKVKRKTLAAHFDLTDVFSSKKQAALETRPAYSPPRSSREKTLAKIWEKALGISPLGIHDNFFDLGGHSLLAVEIFAEIETKLGKSLSPTTLFNFPTLGQLSRSMEPSAVSDQPWDSLVLLKAGGNKTPLFLVHEADGEIILYLQLARRLHPDRPVYALRPYGKEGFPMLHTRTIDVVNHYLRRIRSIQPQGPYLLGGLCMGGILALRLAQTLQSEGQKIGLLAIMDARSPDAYVARSQSELREIKGMYKLLLFKRLIDHNLPLPSFLYNRISVRMMFRLLWKKFGWLSSQKFKGRIILFRANDGGGGLDSPIRHLTPSPFFGWEKWATKGVGAYDISGSHTGMMKEPHVQSIAEHLEKCMEGKASL